MKKIIYSLFIIIGFSSCSKSDGISESNSEIRGKWDLDYTIKYEGANNTPTTIPDNGDISYNFGVSEVTISGFKIEGKWGDGIFGDREPEVVKKEAFTENRGYWISEDNKKLTIKNEYNISEPYDIIELTKSKLVLKTTFGHKVDLFFVKSK
ncbi:hypothetical protein [Sphingobacterium humi]|uniref:Lipocalin-like domain-containing protein n=1 Tax=Sphingobacterium humi TaxID=1796905 RepID=A0A6N8L2Z3_9SPHI|nr:hypothetical protein [Sphingobacterium humi]MVZ62152.1 hypothetical protein [Sphingobacterium humi]